MASTISRVAVINKAKHFGILVSGLSREDIKYVQMKLPDICNKVQSKCVTLAMPIKEDGKVTIHVHKIFKSTLKFISL